LVYTTGPENKFFTLFWNDLFTFILIFIAFVFIDDKAAITSILFVNSI